MAGKRLAISIFDAEADADEAAATLHQAGAVVDELDEAALREASESADA